MNTGGKRTLNYKIITYGLAASFALAAGGWTIHAINNPDTVEDMPEIDRVKYAQAAPRFNPALWNDLHTDKKIYENPFRSIQTAMPTLLIIEYRKTSTHSQYPA